VQQSLGQRLDAVMLGDSGQALEGGVAMRVFHAIVRGQGQCQLARATLASSAGVLSALGRVE